MISGVTATSLSTAGASAACRVGLDLSAGEVLAAAEANVVDRRRVEAERLLLVLAWCDRNGEDPQARPGAAVPVARGGDRLVRPGGDGTPEVAELCFGELAIACETGTVAVRNLAADALDLRHRFPLLFARLCAGQVEPWVARRVASMSRDLDRHVVGIVDRAVAAAFEESAHRVLEIAEAKVIEADPDAHRRKIEVEELRTGVWLGRRRTPARGTTPGVDEVESGTRRLAAKVPNATAVEVDAVLDDLADALAAHATDGDGRDDGGEPLTRNELRVRALDLLSRPHDAVRFLDGLDAGIGPDTDLENGSDAQQTRRRRRRRAVIHVHLSAAALRSDLVTGSVARVEDLGPMLLEQVAGLLGRRDIDLQPVIDLNAVTAVNGYEHPDMVRARVALRHAGGGQGRDAFPHSASTTGRVDLDHATPYDGREPTGQPGQPGQPAQTGDHNAQPLTRTHHRMKTHLGYTVTQLGLAAHRWITPHGLARVVTPHGTTKVQPIRARDGTTSAVVGELYPRRYELDLQLE